jgi:glucose/arabinose dehydrogenase
VKVITSQPIKMVVFMGCCSQIAKAECLISGTPPSECAFCLAEISAMRRILVLAGLILLVGCGGGTTLPSSAGFGPNPTLPEPHAQTIPTIRVAPAAGWAQDEQPVAAAGLQVAAYARGLDHPRWLYVLPNGDVLVAETNAPADRPEEKKGIRAWFMGLFMSHAGAAVPSPDRISLLRDADGDGVAETRTVFLQGLHSPFGMTLVGDDLYVADTDALLRFPYRTGETQISAQPTRMLDLPAGPRNHHWTKNVIASPDGARLYVTVGSNSNVGENGMDEEEGRAAIWEVDRATGNHRMFATGLRNPNGMDWEPSGGALWTAVNERDEIGDDLVPDYMTSVRDGGFYGWPYYYYGTHRDERIAIPANVRLREANVPDYALGAHTASLGLVFARGAVGLPANYRDGAFVGQHGSWNRSEPSGYKVIFVPFADGRPNGPPQEVLTGFLDERGRANGRPVGVVMDGRGGLLVADDVGNAVWRVISARNAAQ